MTKALLQATASKALQNGPDRVVVDGDGRAVSAKRARKEYGVLADIIFIRRDGWTLGAPAELEVTAYRLWDDEWAGFIRRPETHARPIRWWLPS